MRGKAKFFPVFPHNPRITPAYAGKSGIAADHAPQAQDHPRVCGEKIVCYHYMLCYPGSPPRMRGKEDTGTAWRWLMRITPAYAGKRIPGQKMLVQQWDHPRVCGEKSLLMKLTCFMVGSPPRMRGKVHCDCLPEFVDRDHPRVCGEKEFQSKTNRQNMGSPPRMRGKAPLG